MVTAGGVRARVVCLRLCELGMMLGVCVCVALLPEFACSRVFLDGCRCCGVRRVCVGCVMDWSDAFGVSVVCSICGIGCV